MATVISSFLGFFVSIITAISLFFGGIGTDSNQPAIMMVSPYNSYTVLQGGCSDGEYGYIVMHNGQKNGNSHLAEASIAKIDLESCKVVDKYNDLKIGHANDLCYNSKTNEIIAVHSGIEEESNLITVFDKETMEIKQTVKLPVKIYAMDYDEQENCYYAFLRSGFNFAKLSSDFKVTKRFSTVETSGTKQTVAVKGDYIYIVMCYDNRIIKIDKDGNHISTLTLPVTGNEAECIFFIDNQCYVGYWQSAFNGAIIYKVNL